jgi:hypothetical protein
VVADIDGVVEVVALTIAEYVPRQVMHLQQILAGFHYSVPRQSDPSLGDAASASASSSWIVSGS